MIKVKVTHVKCISELPQGKVKLGTHIYSRTFPVKCKGEATHSSVIAKKVNREFNIMYHTIKQLMNQPREYFNGKEL
jgi:hypothetical protein